MFADEGCGDATARVYFDFDRTDLKAQSVSVLEEALTRYGLPVPAPTRAARPYATAGLAAFLVLLYGLQLWAGSRFGTNAWPVAGL